VSRAKEAAKNKRRRKFFVCEPDHVVTDAEWNQMQYHLDRCFCAWVIRHGPTAVYNYMHFFGADHILYYGKRWKNLAILNQQGLKLAKDGIKHLQIIAPKEEAELESKKKKTNIMQDLIRRVLRRIGLGIIKKKPKEERGRFYKKKKKVEWKKNKKN